MVEIDFGDDIVRMRRDMPTTVVLALRTITSMQVQVESRASHRGVGAWHVARYHRYSSMTCVEACRSDGMDISLPPHVSRRRHWHQLQDVHHKTQAFLVEGSTCRLCISQRSRRCVVKLAWTVIVSWRQIQTCIRSLDLTKPNYVYY